MNCKEFMEQLSSKTNIPYEYHEHLETYLLNNNKYQIQLRHTKKSDDDIVYMFVEELQKLTREEDEDIFIWCNPVSIFHFSYDMDNDVNVYRHITQNNIKYVNNFIRKYFNVEIEEQ